MPAPQTMTAVPGPSSSGASYARIVPAFAQAGGIVVEIETIPNGTPVSAYCDTVTDLKLVASTNAGSLPAQPSTIP